jgi:hypothetical protein
MVEYALVLAHNATGAFANGAMSWASQLHWESLGYAALGLVALRIAVWAFRPSH